MLVNDYEAVNRRGCGKVDIRRRIPPHPVVDHRLSTGGAKYPHVSCTGRYSKCGGESQILPRSVHRRSEVPQAPTARPGEHDSERMDRYVGRLDEAAVITDTAKVRSDTGRGRGAVQGAVVISGWLA
jgi:hypothetical protein